MEARSTYVDSSFAIFSLYANVTTTCYATITSKFGERDRSGSAAISEAPRLQEPKRVARNAVQAAVIVDAINEQVSEQAR